MSTLVLDAIGASLLELERLTTAPMGELGYGRDLSCVLDLTRDLAEVDPDSVIGIGEAALRRLVTPRGGLPDDPDYGLDVRGFLNRGVTTEDVRDLAGRIRLELGKDDRIDDCTVTATMPRPRTLSVAIRITPAIAGLAPFDLVFAVVDGALTVEAIG